VKVSTTPSQNTACNALVQAVTTTNIVLNQITGNKISIRHDELNEVYVVNAALNAGKAKVDILDLAARIHSKRNSIRFESTVKSR
jgi:hypothetical protein